MITWWSGVILLYILNCPIILLPNVQVKCPSPRKAMTKAAWIDAAQPSMEPHGSWHHPLPISLVACKYRGWSPLPGHHYEFQPVESSEGKKHHQLSYVLKCVVGVCSINLYWQRLPGRSNEQLWSLTALGHHVPWPSLSNWEHVRWEEAEENHVPYRNRPLREKARECEASSSNKRLLDTIRNLRPLQQPRKSSILVSGKLTLLRWSLI